MEGQQANRFCQSRCDSIRCARCSRCFCLSSALETCGWRSQGTTCLFRWKKSCTIWAGQNTETVRCWLVWAMEKQRSCRELMLVILIPSLSNLNATISLYHIHLWIYVNPFHPLDAKKTTAHPTMDVKGLFLPQPHINHHKPMFTLYFPNWFHGAPQATLGSNHLHVSCVLLSPHDAVFLRCSHKGNDSELVISYRSVCFFLPLTCTNDCSNVYTTHILHMVPILGPSRCPFTSFH